MTTREPNPPSRKEEDFPKTTTIPDGWIMDALMEVYNSSVTAPEPRAAVHEQHSTPVPATGKVNGKVNGKARPVETGTQPEPAEAKTEGLFSRRLDPFPSARDQSGMWL
jgi:hypothetical protein